ncbi:response regulator [Bartonella sp. DGB1]|uniref:response regulator n=1 Tax=Bartonella sp. DGB1 TaxID=3239807 RepID=UPI0035260362
MKKKVMVVEDNELNMKLFCDLLESCGYETIKVKDGVNIVEIVNKHMPNLILMDIQLPEISGLEAMKLVKQEEQIKHIPIIAVTAFAMRGDEEKMLQGGCEDYISKPISIEPFLTKIKSYLGDL